MLISPAYAQAAAPGGGFDIVSLAPLILIFVVFYFLLIRPQQKKVKEHRAMIAAVRRGDTVVTGGGIYGKVTKVIDNESLQVEIAEGIRVKVLRGTIADVRAKGEPVKDAGNADQFGATTASSNTGIAEKKSGFLSKLRK